MRQVWRHRWDVSPAAARGLQIQGRQSGSATTGLPPRFFLGQGRIAAADVAYHAPSDMCFAAVVLWDLKSQAEVWSAARAAPSTFPYVPGLLSFREIPPLLPLLRRVPGAVDLILCDGQGIAHPRRFGLASHLGVLFDVPSLGWAKSRLLGEFGRLDARRGAAAALMDGGEQVGWALRSREGCRPVFISPGHRLSMDDSLRVARLLMGRWRLCEPSRLAHARTTAAMREYHPED